MLIFNYIKKAKDELAIGGIDNTFVGGGVLHIDKSPHPMEHLLIVS
jgi:hypothetical protein